MAGFFGRRLTSAGNPLDADTREAILGSFPLEIVNSSAYLSRKSGERGKQTLLISFCVARRL